MTQGSGSACPLCGADSPLKYPPSSNHQAASDHRVFSCTNAHAGDHGPVYWCGACRLGFAPSEASENVLRLYEDVEDPEYLHELDSRKRHAQAILRTVERWRKPGRLLEIGSQVGIFLRAAQDRGWTTLGIEPSHWAVATGRALLGVNLVNGSLEEAEFAPESFDCIVMVDVLEHLVDPLQALRRCRPWLAPDGVLVLSTVNMGTLSARLLGTQWPGFMDMHLTYFTPASLREFLRRSDFRWVASRPDRRTFTLGYVGGRLQHNSGPLRVAGRVAGLPILRGIPFVFPTKDLILVVAKGGHVA